MVPVRVAYNNNNNMITWYNKAYIMARGHCIKASVFERRISPGLAEIIVTALSLSFLCAVAS